MKIPRSGGNAVGALLTEPLFSILGLPSPYEDPPDLAINFDATSGVSPADSTEQAVILLRPGGRARLILEETEGEEKWAVERFPAAFRSYEECRDTRRNYGMNDASYVLTFSIPEHEVPGTEACIVLRRGDKSIRFDVRVVSPR